MRNIFVFSLIKVRLPFTQANLLQIGFENNYNGTEHLNSQTRIHNKITFSSAVLTLVITCSLLSLLLFFKYKHKIAKIFSGGQGI